jgi:hypothetical protein
MSVRLRLTVVVVVMSPSWVSLGRQRRRRPVERELGGCLLEEEGRAGDSRCCCMIKFFRGSIKGGGDR